MKDSARGSVSTGQPRHCFSPSHGRRDRAQSPGRSKGTHQHGTLTHPARHLFPRGDRDYDDTGWASASGVRCSRTSHSMDGDSHHAPAGSTLLPPRGPRTSPTFAARSPPDGRQDYYGAHAKLNPAPQVAITGESGYGACTPFRHLLIQRGVGEEVKHLLTAMPTADRYERLSLGIPKTRHHSLHI